MTFALERVLQHIVGASVGIVAVLAVYWLFFSNVEVAQPLEGDGLLRNYDAIPSDNRLALLKVAARRAFDRDLDIKLGFSLSHLCARSEDFGVDLASFEGTASVGSLSGGNNRYFRMVSQADYANIRGLCDAEANYPNFLFLLTSSNELRKEFRRFDITHDFVALENARVEEQKTD